MKCLNLGCGNRWHLRWTNLDFVSKDKCVIAHNLNQAIPFADECFEVVYSSHLLEHFSKDKAEVFLRECYRVLKPGGVLRVVVPDLERISRDYIMALEKASSGSQEWAYNYDWILIQMYSMAVMNEPGGEMVKYFSAPVPNKDFLLERLGERAYNFLESRVPQRQEYKPVIVENRIMRWIGRIKRFILNPAYRRESLIKLILNKEYGALEIGRFRQMGDIHQWMYDRYSLRIIMQKSGFKNVAQRRAYESYIPDWKRFNLDTEENGSVVRPDSLFMEGIKPEQ